MKIKVNDNVKMLSDTEWWAKGDIGRIVRKDRGNSYLICFDVDVCTNEHCRAGNHHWFAGKEDFELYRPNRFMKVE